MCKTIIRSYGAYSPKQHGTPWVAEVDILGNIIFGGESQKKVGKYSGGYATGNKGDLIIYNPKDGKVYAYGRKNYTRTEKPQAKSKDVYFVIYLNGVFKPCDKLGMILDVWGLDTRNKKEYSKIIL
jgi:hypothetical protein